LFKNTSIHLRDKREKTDSQTDAHTKALGQLDCLMPPSTAEAYSGGATQCNVKLSAGGRGREVI